MSLIDSTFFEKAEQEFTNGFLLEADLYSAASKVKLPYEVRKGEATLYRGSLREETRPVELFADYKTFDKIGPGPLTQDALLAHMFQFGAEAAQGINSYIRLENAKNADGNDPRNTKDLKVANIFEFADGHRNLEIIGVDAADSVNLADPFKQIPGWIAYRFFFACASIKMEYKVGQKGE